MAQGTYEAMEALYDLEDNSIFYATDEFGKDVVDYIEENQQE